MCSFVSRWWFEMVLSWLVIHVILASECTVKLSSNAELKSQLLSKKKKISLFAKKNKNKSESVHMQHSLIFFPRCGICSQTPPPQDSEQTPPSVKSHMRLDGFICYLPRGRSLSFKLFSWLCSSGNEYYCFDPWAIAKPWACEYSAKSFNHIRHESALEQNMCDCIQ